MGHIIGVHRGKASPSLPSEPAMTSSTIHIHDLCKTYLVRERESGAAAALKSLVRRRMVEIPAVEARQSLPAPGIVIFMFRRLLYETMLQPHDVPVGYDAQDLIPLIRDRKRPVVIAREHLRRFFEGAIRVQADYIFYHSIFQ